MMQFGFIYLSRGRCYFVFPTFLAITPSLVLLHGNVHNFACNILILRDNFGIIFDGIRGAAVTSFPDFFGIVISRHLLNEIAQKFMCKIYIIRNNNYAF